MSRTGAMSLFRDSCVDKRAASLNSSEQQFLSIIVTCNYNEYQLTIDWTLHANLGKDSHCTSTDNNIDMIFLCNIIIKTKIVYCIQGYKVIDASACI